MLIDCERCPVRGQACGGCVVSVLFGEAPPIADADAAERAALQVLAEAGFEVTVLAREQSRPRLPVAAARRRSSAA